METTNEIFCRCLKERLEKRGWRLKELASATGLSVSGIQAIVSGTRWPQAVNIDRIASALGVHPSELFGAKEAYAKYTPVELVESLNKYIKLHHSASVHKKT